MQSTLHQPRHHRGQSALSGLSAGTARCLLVVMILCLISQFAAAEPVYSKSRRFRIPFQFDAEELKRLGAREVQLFVSRDAGGHWAASESVPPATSKFTFEAPEDGDYWFSVKTLTSGGLEYPAGPHQASLNVIVDTTPPLLELQLEEVEPGRVRLTWSTSDTHLDLNSLKLEFTEPDDTNWQNVAIRTQERGQTTWTANRSGTVQARGVISDAAGNLTEAKAQVVLATVPQPGNERPDYSRPVATDPPPASQVVVNAPLKNPPPSPQLTSTPSNVTPLVNTPLPPPASDVNRPPQNAISSVNSAGKHHVNSTTFRIGYEIDGAGPSGIGSVNLYITEDGGLRWFHYGADPDRVSPMEITVPRDGEYGFAFRIANGLGRVAIPPQPGERPEVLVDVDRAPPIAKLLPVQSAGNQDLSKVLIEWSAQDRQLAERPVALFYAVTPSGPWESIPGPLGNTGRFLWSVPETVNQPFYIRLDVQDAAGNMTRVSTEQPFLVDRSQPRARVTEVESLSRSSR